MLWKLKYHEQKLLEIVGFTNWKSGYALKEKHVSRKYHIQKWEDYTKYNKLCGAIF